MSAQEAVSIEPQHSISRVVSIPSAPTRHWYVMLDCRFREPADIADAMAKPVPLWKRILPRQKMRGYYRCLAVAAPSREIAHQLAVDDTVRNPYFLLNASEIEVVELEEIARDDSRFRRASDRPGPDPIWFRDGGGYYW